MVKKFMITLMACVVGLSTYGQTDFKLQKEIKPFENLDLSVSASTLGFGLEFESPLSKSVGIRGGFHFVPRFKHEMSFGVSLENDEVDENRDPNGPSKFDEMADIFTEFTGCRVDDEVVMVGEPTFYNLSLMVDVSPFKDKRWHFTGGLFVGPSRIAKAYNTTEDMPTLFSVKLYNRMYQSAYDDVPLFVYGDQVVYVDPDLADKLLEYGRMQMKLGEKVDGSGDYSIEPDEDSMVKADMKVNRFRPYLGFGYSNKMGKTKSNSKYSFSFDAGLIFWGGAPSIITHDGTDLTRDVKNIEGGVGQYVRVTKFFKVYPMLSFKISRRLF